ncbi:hypothetical protein ID854_14460 [Xenorhabdus sp. M]|uniref:Uncharacterized protein n=1 Tax=Xenorhabdus szentirmaii TaxID=290112 RepID=A0AAW3YUE8_9GAMM|nr:hypothetical protein [Xenorhabdus sp. M]MBD2801615.1 hypothetical protein [Xenorhabdus sp. M]
MNLSLYQIISLAAYGNAYLSGEKYDHYFSDNYLPKEYLQLFNCCRSAWVFGGMGSWNDIYFSDKDINQEYHSLSDKLFELIHIALLVVSNPSPRPTTPKE